MGTTRKNHGDPMRYRILRAEGWGALEKQVAEALKNDWVPLGGVTAVANSFCVTLGIHPTGETTSFCVAQAMVQRDPGER